MFFLGLDDKLEGTFLIPMVYYYKISLIFATEISQAEKSRQFEGPLNKLCIVLMNGTYSKTHLIKRVRHQLWVQLVFKV